MNGTTSRLWVATKTTVSAYDATGTVVQSLDLGPRPDVVDLALDADSGELWVVLKKNVLRRYDSAGTPVFEANMDALERIASDGQGGVWVATGKSLFRLTAAGQVLFELDQFGGNDRTIALAANPAEASAWAAARKALRHLSAPDGQTLHTVAFQEPNIHDVAVYADIIAPVLTIDAPAEGGLLNTNTPTIELSYSDNGIGVDVGTLIIANGSVLDVTCTFDTSSATCTPNSPLTEGPITLSATIEDFGGNLSSPATVSFTVDTIPPDIAFTAPANGAVIDTDTPTIEVSYSDSGSGVNTHTLLIQSNGNPLAVSCTSGSSSATCTLNAPLPEGPITLTATIEDQVGNISQPAEVSFTIEIMPPAPFTLTVEPGEADVIQGQSVSYAVTLNSPGGFSQLAVLDVTGLPAGVTGSFKPQQITAGQAALLTITAPESQPPTTATLSLSASATVNGTDVASATDAVLNILPITTSFLGRAVVDDTLQTPLAGVTVTLLGVDGNGNPTGCSGETVSDAAGNFMFTNLPAECTGGQLIRYNGTTATNPPGDYAGVDLFYNIVANQVTVSPVLIHLPRTDDKEVACVEQNAPVDQILTFQTIPNLSAIVYAGTTFAPHPSYPPPTGRCPAGQFPLIAIEVPVDRLPDEMPLDPNNVMPFIVAFQPANTVASQPVAVFFPNRLNTPPGTAVELSTLDPTKGVMVIYGTGVVSEDGTQIIPDFDPANPGKRFGLVHFDWHGATMGPGGPGCGGACCPARRLEVVEAFLPAAVFSLADLYR